MSEPLYVEHRDPMLDAHTRTLDPACSCDYTPIRRGDLQTIAIHREVDMACGLHGADV